MLRVRLAYVRVSKRFMLLDRVEVLPPVFDYSFGFAQCLEDFTINRFIAWACVKILKIAKFFSEPNWWDVRGLRRSGAILE